MQAEAASKHARRTSRTVRVGRVVSMTLLAAAACAPAMAQAPTERDRLAGLRACADIADPARRLTCFDQQTAQVLAAVDTGELRLVERKEIERTRRSLFGFTVPKLGVLGGPDEASDTLETVITSARSAGQDAWIIEIAEGSQWQITNAPSRLRAPKAGDKVVIKRASLGSFFIRIAGQTGVKGRRIG